MFNLTLTVWFACCTLYVVFRYLCVVVPAAWYVGATSGLNIGMYLHVLFFRKHIESFW